MGSQNVRNNSLKFCNVDDRAVSRLSSTSSRNSQALGPMGGLHDAQKLDCILTGQKLDDKLKIAEANDIDL